jgi:hypothetical protein
VEHTKGEWVIVPLADNEFAIKEKELHKRGFSDRIATVGCYPEAKANAYLIAAAPAATKVLFDTYSYLLRNMPEEQKISIDGQFLLATIRHQLSVSYDTTETEIVKKARQQ